MSPPESSVAAAVPAAAPRPTLPQALLVLAAVVLAIAGYLFLAAALGVRESYVGFVFVFYWLTFDQGQVKRLPPLLLGLSFGLAAAWLLQYALHSPHSGPLLGIFLAAVAVSIVGLILARLPLVFNTPAMLALTVFTIPHIQQGASFPWLFVALGFATAYFALFVGVLKRLAARMAPR
jgi:hypothetical protein